MLGKLKLLGILLVIGLFTPLQAYATGGVPTSYSTNYSVNQVLFGDGGDGPTGLESSPNYESQVSLGETGVGNYVGGTNYQAYAGFNTTDHPYLEINVTGANLNLGVLSRSSTATTTTTFYVRSWLAHGYIVQTSGAPPTNSTYSMATPATATSSAVGTEQFGMNLVANTTPTTFGANPSQTTTYAYGAAYGNYATANKYAYNNGDIIAQSTQSTSSTIYTISYIFNISGTTPGGNYTFNQSLVATSTY